ncbi:MAG: phage virion morphogenesis protein, partial [Chloroflexi bacterium]|nr:phage virion morphogenesis protein [Chloroflexota bacterium]
MAIEIQVRGEKRLRDKLRRAEGRSKNLKPANLKAAVLIESWTLRNMNAEGKKHDESPLHWPGLAESTKRQRASKGHWPGRMLQVSGRLKNAFETSADKKSGRVVNRVKYARFH